MVSRKDFLKKIRPEEFKINANYWVIINKEFYLAQYIREDNNYYVFKLGEKEVDLTKKHFGVWWEVVSGW